MDGKLSPKDSPIEVPTTRKIEEYVSSRDGHTPVFKILIANNGIAAVKEIKSIRKWCFETFGDERAIEFIVLATPEDIEANAEAIRLADHYHKVQGGANYMNFANVDLIVDIAEQLNVDAVYAGWGHASENPRLPETLALTSRNILFIGPPGYAMRSLGDKISSLIVAQNAQVPTMDWNGSNFKMVNRTEAGHVFVDDSAYLQCTITDIEKGIASAKQIGFPVMIKASMGGGGKGIRIVNKEEDFRNMFNLVQREVAGSPIFIMKVIEDARHVEVQIIADEYGNVISLYGRDCSVQRRHQKIIEEAPVTIVSEETFEEMEKAAIRLAKLVGYIGAGTVEYLYCLKDDKFYFLELNPRLQVEHPTTEAVTSINIPAVQLQIAMGIPLHKINDIRKFYDLDVHSDIVIDFETASRKKPKGHVIAARITAENPDAGFKPGSGKLVELTFRGNGQTWGYFSVGQKGGVHEYSDSQFGHIFAQGETREEARKNLVMALKEISIRGDFRTTVEYLIELAGLNDFINNSFNTRWLDKLIEERFQSSRPEWFIVAICGAVSLGYKAINTNIKQFSKAIERGQFPTLKDLQKQTNVEFVYDQIQYNFDVVMSGPELYTVKKDKWFLETHCIYTADNGYLIRIDKKTYVVYLKKDVLNTRLIINGKTCLLEKENDPTIIRSPSPGKLVRYLVDDGASLKKGMPYVEIESMKMYMTLNVTENGKIHFAKPAGSSINAGDILAVLRLDEPTKFKKAATSVDPIPLSGIADNYSGEKSHKQLKCICSSIEWILDGYPTSLNIQTLYKSFRELFKDNSFLFGELKDILSTLAGRISDKMERDILDGFFTLDNIEDSISSLIELKDPIFDPLIRLLTQQRKGIRDYEITLVLSFIEIFLKVERIFSENHDDSLILQILRNHFKEDTNSITVAISSHLLLNQRLELMMLFLDHLWDTKGDLDEFSNQVAPVLRIISQLNRKAYAQLTIKATEILIHYSKPLLTEQSYVLFNLLEASYSITHNDENILNERNSPNIHPVTPISTSPNSIGPSDSSKKSSPVQEEIEIDIKRIDLKMSKETIEKLVCGHTLSNDSLVEFLYGGKLLIVMAAMEVYARRIFNFFEESDNFSHYVIYSTIPAIEWAIDSEKRGLMLAISNVVVPKYFEFSLAAVLEKSNSFNIYLIVDADEKDTLICRFLEPFLKFKDHISRITIVYSKQNASKLEYYTFKKELEFEEDAILRNIEPEMYHVLEFSKLSNYNLTYLYTDQTGRIFIYKGKCLNKPSDARLFCRVIVNDDSRLTRFATTESFQKECNYLLDLILNSLAIHQADPYDSNHIFVNCFSAFYADPKAISKIIYDFVVLDAIRMLKLKLCEAEIRVPLLDELTVLKAPIVYRFLLRIDFGCIVNIEIYREESVNGRIILNSYDENYLGSMHLKDSLTPYPSMDGLQAKRLKAQALSTTYVYDFPHLIRQAVLMHWDRWIKRNPKVYLKIPEKLIETLELVLDGKGVSLVDRPYGLNNIGMVAWKMRIYTPEEPNGRDMVVICNDITFEMGSFGVKEDELFYQSSKYARSLGIPRIYIAANSGARIGLSGDVRKVFKIKWKDTSDHSLGFDYLYLDADTYEAYKDQVLVDKINDDEYKIIEIFGKEEGLGVENLKGSAKIARETNLAYSEIFTVSYASGRSVGIGAYLMRLGQRIIQKEKQPIILTGNQALNKVLGKLVYSSNLQLGGPQIMMRNGVSHLLVNNDLQGLYEIVRWLSFIPPTCDSPLPVLYSLDPLDRDVEIVPSQTPDFDPRLLITGTVNENGQYISGMFDRYSFVETLKEWAQTVIVGRCRLGGIPVGVILSETRTVNMTIPADPASPNSEEVNVSQAGGVWYPDSAYKTAQAISDFNYGEKLPIFILANWRGFSGGQQDMYNQILKYGSMIVEQLRNVVQPVFVYILPFAELRGGAWVVIDSEINPDFIEMYADPTSKAGILEPEGIAEIKYRRSHIEDTMLRLDSTYQSLTEKVSNASGEILKEWKSEKNSYVKKVEGVYQSVAVHYAALHDNPGRLLHKNCIKDIVPWKSSRRYFYQRLAERLK